MPKKIVKKVIKKKAVVVKELVKKIVSKKEPQTMEELLKQTGYELKGLKKASWLKG